MMRLIGNGDPPAMNTAVILSTYNNPQALYKSLLGFTVQTHDDFELIVADDGSNASTAEILRRPEFGNLVIRHVWQSDEGFRKCRILNQAILASDADYLIFSDGDCIPRDDFVANHLRLSRPKTFVSANRVNVPEKIHIAFDDEDIRSNRIFEFDFLANQDPRLRKYRWRLSRRRWWQRCGDIVTWRYCVFTGCNGAAWRDDLINVNGFDEGFGYGSDDRELGVRLANLGIGSRFCKFSLIVIHQDHPYDYDQDVHRRNREVFKQRWRDGIVRAPCGIHEILSCAPDEQDIMTSTVYHEHA